LISTANGRDKADQFSRRTSGPEVAGGYPSEL
jgi:hypothetical protein